MVSGTLTPLYTVFGLIGDEDRLNGEIIRPSVHPSVRLSVRLSVRPSRVVAQ